MLHQSLKVKDFLNLLRTNVNVTFRTKDGHDICTTTSNSVGINPYKNNIIIEWLPFSYGGVCFYIDIEE